MKENKGKRFRLPSNRFLAALIVVALTIASLGVTMTLLGCNDDSTAIFCDGCALEVVVSKEHEISCGETAHFSCDGFTHGLAACGEHYACIDAMAEYQAEIKDPTNQDRFLADIKADYSKAAAEQHKAAECKVEGHFVCDGKEHSADSCKEAGHTHTFGEATCIAPAACTIEGCTETNGEVNANNHAGGTEVKNAKAATCAAEGYSGDTYCKGCNAVIQKGSATAKSTTHSGGTEVKGKKDATCAAEGYTGDTYCKGCNTVIQKGSATAKSTNHTGGTEVKNAKEATCCETGFSGDTYCKGCGAKISSGSSVAATGNHPAAVCCKSGHHAHDNKNHEGAECLILGHFVCDGKDHTDWMCLSSEEQSNTVRVEVTIANPGSTWSYTIGGHTISNENINTYEHEVLLGGYSIKVYMTTLQGYTFTIDTTNGKKVYIDDYSENAGYNDKVVNGEDPVTITVSKNMLKAETYGDYTYYTLFITIMD